MDRIINFLVSVQDNRESWEIKHLLSNIVLLIFFAACQVRKHWII